MRGYPLNYFTTHFVNSIMILAGPPGMFIPCGRPKRWVSSTGTPLFSVTRRGGLSKHVQQDPCGTLVRIGPTRISLNCGGWQNSDFKMVPVRVHSVSGRRLQRMGWEEDDYRRGKYRVGERRWGKKLCFVMRVHIQTLCMYALCTTKTCYQQKE